MHNVKHTILNVFNDVVGKVKGPMKESKFYSEGKLTPEEYILAGDFITQKCPTWKWCAADKNFSNKNLPQDKQYLKTTVSCTRRAEDYNKENLTFEKIVEGDWVETGLVNAVDKKAALDLEDEPDKKKEEVPSKGLDLDADDDEEEANKEEAGPSEFDDFVILEEEKNNPDPKFRTYDVTVTYDFYYCVPRMWLMGYSNTGKPLTDDEMKLDIMMEYRNQTVTIDPHPCTGIRNISVHPCRHSLLLKKMIENFENAGKKLDIEMSILIFLKFLHSVVPTIQYDYTLDINF